MLYQLGQIAEIRMGYPFRSRLEHDPRGEVAVIQMKDIDDSNLIHVEGALRMTLPSMHDRHVICDGDLLFRSRGRTNSAALVVGSLGIAVLASPMMMIRPTKVLPAYLHWFINLTSTQATLSGQATGTSVMMIGKAALEALEVPVPSEKDQRRIADLAVLGAKEQALMGSIAAKRKTLIEGRLLDAATKQTSASKHSPGIARDIEQS